MKSLLLCLVLLCSGCAAVTSEDVKVAAWVCKDNGGYLVVNTFFNHIDCADGTSVSLNGAKEIYIEHH